jgi:hypothetical protein
MAVRTAMGSVDLTVSQTLRSVTWPNVAVVSIRPHLRALIERETNEPDESRQTDKCKEPIGHIQASLIAARFDPCEVWKNLCRRQ